MTEREKAFCEYYAASGNGAEAARKAGYSEKAARGQARRLLTKAHIQNYLHSLTEKTQAERIASAEETRGILTELLRDPGQRASDRIRAASALLRASGEMHGAASQEAAADVPGRKDDGVDIVLPWDHKGPINALQGPDGSVVPLQGVPDDEDVFTFLPWDQELYTALGIADRFIQDDGSDPIYPMSL